MSPETAPDAGSFRARTTAAGRRTWLTWVVGLAVCGTWADGQRAAPPAPDGPAAELWRRIDGLRDGFARAAGPVDFDDAVAQRKRLLEAARAYLTLYPGGANRTDVIRLELLTRFELGSLAGGDYQALIRAAQQYRDEREPVAVRSEAAYWLLVVSRTRPAEQPATAPCAAPTTAPGTRPPTTLATAQTTRSGWLDACRAFIRRYPGSRHVPRLIEAAVDRAAEVPESELVRWEGLLRRHHPQEPVTRAIAGRLARQRAIGTPFWLSAEVDGRIIDTRHDAGRTVLIVCWRPGGDGPAALLTAVERFRRAHPAELSVYGVLVGAANVRTTSRSVDWPCVAADPSAPDGFATRWGVTEVPLVFIIDRTGILAAVETADSWQAAASSILAAD